MADAPGAAATFTQVMVMMADTDQAGVLDNSLESGLLTVAYVDILGRIAELGTEHPMTARFRAEAGAVALEALSFLPWSWFSADVRGEVPVWFLDEPGPFARTDRLDVVAARAEAILADVGRDPEASARLLAADMTDRQTGMADLIQGRPVTGADALLFTGSL
ncbi:MAG: hypothetical protein ACRD0U_15550, partial [Acidimicrobiales bacterium]